MAGLCADRVVIVTGAGRGLGRQHALEFARQGAKVVVNDPGHVSQFPCGADRRPDALWRRSRRRRMLRIRLLLRLARERPDHRPHPPGIERHTLGAERDGAGSSSGPATAVRVHLRGTFAPSRAAMACWRDRAKAGEPRAARIITTFSPAGLYGNIGQANYAAAKAGIAAFTMTTAREVASYGITVNSIGPEALTRMTEDLPMVAEEVAEARRDPDAYHHRDAANVSPLVVWLGSEASGSVTGQVFHVVGGQVSVVEGWRIGPEVDIGKRWDPAALGDVVPGLVARAQAPLALDGRTPFPIGGPA